MWKYLNVPMSQNSVCVLLQLSWFKCHREWWSGWLGIVVPQWRHHKSRLGEVAVSFLQANVYVQELTGRGQLWNGRDASAFPESSCLAGGFLYSQCRISVSAPRNWTVFFVGGGAGDKMRLCNQCYWMSQSKRSGGASHGGTKVDLSTREDLHDFKVS